MQTEAASILIVDDEPEIRRAVQSGLKAQGYEVRAAPDGEEGLRQATLSMPDMVILDLMMPGMDGLEVCRRLRAFSDIPILILSARSQERQKVQALDLGADDYLTKPFGMDELTARIRAALRRHGRSRSADAPAFTAGDLVMDYTRRLVFKNGDELKLTPHEYGILRYLTQNADRVITHRQLLAAVWGPEDVEETQYLRVHVGHLRKKIEADPARPRLIVTEPGVGYRFRTTDSASS
ncbi:MAG: response regulator transcription factor [Armatimonadota bacterium]|nr:response regulator transcription factor [Armatimonadota bacterium]